jgi:hypothetical protein
MNDESDLTHAQRWTEMARQIIEHEGRDAFASILTHDFVQESRRVDHFGLDRAALLALYDSMKELDFRITGTDIAVAGEFHVLTRRGYHTPQTNTELLAISEWSTGGRLAKLIEFDLDDLDAALTEMSEAAGQPARPIASVAPADG